MLHKPARKKANKETTSTTRTRAQFIWLVEPLCAAEFTWQDGFKLYVQNVPEQGSKPWLSDSEVAKARFNLCMHAAWRDAREKDEDNKESLVYLLVSKLHDGVICI